MKGYRKLIGFAIVCICLTAAVVTHVDQQTLAWFGGFLISGLMTFVYGNKKEHEAENPQPPVAP